MIVCKAKNNKVAHLHEHPNLNFKYTENRSSSKHDNTGTVLYSIYILVALIYTVVGSGTNGGE